jgi:tricorn protease
MKKNLPQTVAVILLSGLLSGAINAQVTKLLRDPAVSADAIAFVYANDLWIVGRDGGEARRLTSSPGAESEPHFSPDGRYIAFTGNYSGNREVYIINSPGGEPRRLTWYPGVNRALDWTNSGKNILFASDRKNPPINNLGLWTVPAEGGLADQLPVKGAFRAAYSESNKMLAYEDERWQSEWKWYRGGQAKPIHVVTFPDLSQTDVPGPVCLNTHPSFLGEQLFFLSDRNGTFNVYTYDNQANSVRQVTTYTDRDVKSLSAGGGMLVYEIDGVIHSLNPVTGTDKELSITVRGDFTLAMKQIKDVRRYIASASLSPKGTRALFEARGEIFTVPAEKGDVRNLSHSSDAADRSPAWSPDGQKIAWFSDRSGEYKLVISDQDGLLPLKEIGIDHPTFFYNLTWSPDSKNIAFTDAGRRLLIMNIEKGTVQCIDTDRMAHPERTMIPVWSSDSRWIAYAKQQNNMYRAIMIYSMKDNTSFKVTDGLSDAVTPVWDLNRKYLYFLASTDGALNTGWLDLSSLERPKRWGVYFAVLAKDAPSPLLPESDEEKATEEPKEKKKEKEDPKKKVDDSLAVKIDFDGMANRILALPLPLRNYVDINFGPAGMVFVSETDLPFYPEHPAGMTMTVQRWDMAKRKATVFLTNARAFSVSQNGSRVLYRQGDDWFITSSQAEIKPGDGRIKVDLMMNLDPLAEWRQIYREAWRLHRDFFYVPNYHGTDWKTVYDKYATLLPYVRHRSDLNYLLDMMGGELAVGHHFVGGGDMGEQKQSNIGLLGADIILENNHYRIKRILTGENWNPELRAPLAAPGINVHEGDWLLAINGIPLIPPATPESALEGFAGKQVILSVNTDPTEVGSHNVTVVPLGNESALRSRSWVEDNRRYVDKLSGGTMAYVWLPNTADDGYNYFNRYYFGQQDKQGAILDERFNGGGDIADYIIDIVARKLRGYFNNPVGKREPWTEPLSGIWGPKVLIINEYAGSGGDMLPFMFRQQQLGPMVGTKTWGGLVGIWDYPDLVDGGVVTVPRGGFFNLKGEWDVENKGIEPDIMVKITPKDISASRDPQLEKAVEEAVRLLKASPVKLLKEPAPPVRLKPDNK